MGLAKNEQQLFPKIFTVRAFKYNSDTRDKSNEIYAYSISVDNKRQEAKFYESLNHEANLIIECKLPNGLIR